MDPFLQSVCLETLLFPEQTMADKPTILIADDEPGVVAALAREARRAGLSYITDTSSHLVHELALKHQPAVIILDLKQHVDGRDLLATLKKDPRTKHIKVLVLSAIEDQFTRHVCLELGADDYDVKPFDPCFMSKVARLAGVKN